MLEDSGEVCGPLGKLAPDLECTKIVLITQKLLLLGSLKQKKAADFW